MRSIKKEINKRSGERWREREGGRERDGRREARGKEMNAGKLRVTGTFFFTEHTLQINIAVLKRFQ